MSIDFLDLAEKRFSVRKFKKDHLSEDELNKIIKAGLLAPTAHNYQPEVIYVINTDESCAKLKKCTTCHYNAPTALLVCYDINKAWVRTCDQKSSGDIDASIVATHMMLEAENLGIGCTWVMHFIPEAVKEEFALGEKIIPVAILVLGYKPSFAPPSTLHFINRKKDKMVKKV